MRNSTISKVFALILVNLVFLGSATIQAQSSIDWNNDTLSRAEVNGGRDTYNATVKKSGLKQTSKVSMPVDKLKTIIDACASKGITDISIMITTIRSVDVARYKRNHPEVAGMPDDSLKWRQLLVLQIPRYAFEGNKSSGIRMSNSTTLLSLLSMGLVLIDRPIGLPGVSGDLYFEFGTICPPPTSCD